MVCKLCSKNTTKYIKVKSGIICPSCYDNLPNMITDNIRDLTPQNIKSVSKIMNKLETTDDFWGYMDDDYTFMFADDKLCVNETEIYYKNIKDIYLNFHPTAKSNSSNSSTGIVKGYTTLVVVTKKPEIVIEKKLNKNKDSIRYSIHGNSITYFYDTLDLLLISNIKKVISKIEKNLNFFKDEFLFKVNETDIERFTREFNEKKQQEKEEEKLRKEYEDIKRKIEEEEKRKREEKFKKHNKNFNTGREWFRNKSNKNSRENKGNINEQRELSNFEKAQQMFGVEIPYTEKKIKRIYYKLMKENHPDEGGSGEYASMINTYYELLKKFAVNK